METLKTVGWYTILLISAFLDQISAQNTILDGYAYETGNRGYLNQVFVQLFDKDSLKLAEAYSNSEGHFMIESDIADGAFIIASKEGFNNTSLEVGRSNDDQKIFLKVEMERMEGYLFEITLAQARTDEDIIVDAIRGADIEVYNNTTELMELVLEDYMHPEFQVQLFKNNHYTILIRKSGYLSKRLEAYVNVEGCILCFEGVGDIKPGVSDNLTDSNLKGVLLSNVELEKVFTGKEFKINNLYYDFGTSRLNESASIILDDLIVLLKDNPYLKVELGSHTDSRGGKKENLSLSRRRAQSAVNYILRNSNIPESHLNFKGYGETKLINKCSDGVECTEEEHSLNRRTEIKILGIDPEIQSISLGERIRQDKEDKLIEELLNQEQVYIVNEDNQAVIDSLNNLSEAEKHIDESLESKSESIKEPNKDLVEQANLDSNEDLFFDTYFSVAFMYSQRKLKEDHKAWSIQGIREYRSSSGHYIYHSGQYETEEEAEKYSQDYIKPIYPNAFIVKFINGQINVNYK